MKFHHKHGSYELIKTLNDRGLVTNYDQVPRFCKSAAQFVLRNAADYHKKLGLITELEPIFSWADNYNYKTKDNLYIASSNGTKSTHAMVSESTQHPASQLSLSLISDYKRHWTDH